MTWPVTPDPGIHQEKNTPQPKPLFTRAQLLQWAEQIPQAMVKDLVQAVLTALGVEIPPSVTNFVSTVRSSLTDLRTFLGNVTGLGSGNPTLPGSFPKSFPFTFGPSGVFASFVPIGQWQQFLDGLVNDGLNGHTPADAIAAVRAEVVKAKSEVAQAIQDGLHFVNQDTGVAQALQHIGLKSLPNITVGGFETDIETAAQSVVDKVADKGAALLTDVKARLQYLANDGTGVLQGVGILHDFGLNGDAAHGNLWDAVCNAFGLPGSGHGLADVQSAAAGINRQLDELINGKKAVLTIVAAAGSGNYNPATIAPFLVTGDLLYPVALGGGSGGAGGSGLVHGVGGLAGQWSSTSVTPLVLGTDWHSGDTFDYVVGPGGTGGAVPGGTSNPGSNSEITLHGGSVVATGSGGASVTGTSSAGDAWWGDGVSPVTNTVDGTPITGGGVQTSAGYGGHSSGGAGAGGNIGISVSAGGAGASGLVAFLAVQA